MIDPRSTSTSFAARLDTLNIDPSDPDDAAELLTSSHHLQTLARLAEAHSIDRLGAYAETVQRRDTTDLPGHEALVRPGDDGTPAVSDFALAEAGVAYGVSFESIWAKVALALNLRHRFPLVRTRMLAGSTPIWRARRLCELAHDLTLEQALVVDQRVAPTINRLGPSRLAVVMDEVLVALGANALDDERTSSEKSDYRADVFLSGDPGCGEAFIRAKLTDTARFDRALDHVADLLKIAGDNSPRDHRRAGAIGWLAQPDKVLALDAWARNCACRQPSADADGLVLGDFPPAPDDTKLTAWRGETPPDLSGPLPSLEWPTLALQLHLDYDTLTRVLRELDDAERLAEPLTDPPGLTDPLADVPADLPERAHARPPVDAGLPPDWYDEPGLPPDWYDEPGVPPDWYDDPTIGVPPDWHDDSTIGAPPGWHDDPIIGAPPGWHDDPTIGAPPGWHDDPTIGAPPGWHDPPDTSPPRDPMAASDAAPPADVSHQGSQGWSSGVGRLAVQTRTGYRDLAVITARHAAELIGESHVTIQPVIDLNDMPTAEGYQARGRLKQAVMLKAHNCAFPHCNRRANLQIDHTIPAPEGKTELSNLAPLCILHHRMKTHGRWLFRQPINGLYVWRSPHGEVYVVDGTGTRPIHPYD